MALESRGQRRLVATGVVYTAVQVSASGRITKAAFDALTCQRVTLGVVGAGSKLRSCEVGAASTGSADSTFTNTVYVAKAGLPAGGNDVQDVELRLLGTLVCTVGSGVGATDTGVVKTTERIVKTMAWTPATIGTTPPGIADYIQANQGSPPIKTQSPGGALSASIMFPDLGNADWLIFDTGSTGGSSIVFYADTGT